MKGLIKSFIQDTLAKVEEGSKRIEDGGKAFQREFNRYGCPKAPKKER